MYAFAFGFCDGCYEMLIPVVTRNIVGVNKVGHAIGAFQRRWARPWWDGFTSYSVSFYITGGLAVIAAAIMFALSCLKPGGESDEGSKGLLVSPGFDGPGSRKTLLYT